MPRIEIYPEEKFNTQWDRQIRDAQASRGDLRKPRVLSLSGNRVLVFKGFPGEAKIDVDPDSYQ